MCRALIKWEKWNCCVKIDITGCNYADWIHVVELSNQSWAVVSTVMNLGDA
jgi:hypothetical protein